MTGHFFKLPSCYAAHQDTFINYFKESKCSKPTQIKNLGRWKTLEQCENM